MPIPFYPFVPRFLKSGMGFLDFLDWLYIHPLVRVPDVTQLATYWSRYGRAGGFRDILKVIPQDLPVPKEYMVGNLYPGRFMNYTYTISYEIQFEPGQPYAERFVTTISDSWLTPEEAISRWKGRVSEQAGASGYLVREFGLHTVEAREFS